MQPIIGLDVGATTIRAGLVGPKAVTGIIKLPTQASRGPRHIVNTVARAINLVRRPGVRAIGIGWAGQIDSASGTVLSSPNMGKGFKRVKVAQLIQKQCRLKTVIENDVKCFTLGESLRGAGKNQPRVIGLTLGTGIGGGLVIDGRLYHGRDGSAGEFGHMIVVPERGRACGCQKKGHLEAYASGTAMIKMYRELTGRTQDTFFIEQAAIAGSRPALKIINTMADHLATGLANILHTLNPDIIIIGGGIANVPLLWKMMRPKLAAKLFRRNLSRTKIVKSTLNSRATMIGAAHLAQPRGRA